ncbi:hypothetical protein C8A01DRAFT_49381 [Parachaetomium inaequale]|uniref:U1-type domain-containing protein n=1 Tax=Parachaetomium inaequale TaxID=2588326 RepID=A0AAN6SNI7_9PEZI|nr:hypothetical protein C8A01DRAFT_49381 [Parachaetomium inaequale]
MKLQFFAVLAMAALAVAQGVTDKIAPKGDHPSGCEANSNGMFEITIVPLTDKAKKELDLETRAACSGDGTLVVQLADGVLTDDHARTGYIASNYQFQFDNPPQAGALITAGFSACANGSLALGDSATFWQCASGTFYNLYDRWSAEQCSPVDVVMLPCGDGGKAQDTQSPAGQTVVGSEVVTTTVVMPLSDGQPQVITTTTLIHICQIGDGQVQGHTTPCTPPAVAGTTPTPVVSFPPASQISDGQVQVTPGPEASVPGAQETVVTSGSGVVPTGAPLVNGAAGGIGGRVGVVVMVALGVAGMHLILRPLFPTTSKMSEYWKSTPKYWCKHCSVFVRDTGLERANHEATAKHQGAIKRSLRDLHRNADQKEREKERAKREVDRLNGVVSGSSGGASSASRPATKPSSGAYGAPPPQQVSQAERQKQLEQLAELGVSIPTELRGNMAMAGEWTVTSTKVIANPGDSTDDKDLAAAEGRATGVKRERERTEEEKEQEEAIKGLFKKPRKWGVGSKTMPVEEDAELDALLSGPLVTAKKEESEAPPVKTEDIQEEAAEGGGDGDGGEPVKQEPSPPIKKEPDEEETGLGVGAAEEREGAAVVFKKRKPKNLRQK